MIKILAWAGSTRKESLNKKLVRYAAKLVQEEGVEVQVVDLADFVVPLYDRDLEEESGLPEKAKEFKKLMIESDAFLISSPEYNKSVPGGMKNLIDWVSRKETPGEPGLVAFDGKVAGVMAMSTGYYGGLRGLRHLREILEQIGTLVIPQQIAISGDESFFDETGNIKDEDRLGEVRGVVHDLVGVVSKLKVNE